MTIKRSSYSHSSERLRIIEKHLKSDNYDELKQQPQRTLGKAYSSYRSIVHVQVIMLNVCFSSVGIYGDRSKILSFFSFFSFHKYTFPLGTIYSSHPSILSLFSAKRHFLLLSPVDNNLHIEKCNTHSF